jgi:hypothetical protein
LFGAGGVGSGAEGGEGGADGGAERELRRQAS